MPGYKRSQPDYPEVVKAVRAKRRKLAEEKADILMAPQYYDPGFTYNAPIRSGAPSGLYNLSTGTKEYKFMDTNLGIGNGTGLSTTLGFSGAATFYILNGIKLGTSASQRIGNKIAMKSLYWSVNFGLRGSDADPTVDIANLNVPVRFMIVYDKQANGAAFTIGDLLTAFSGLDNTTARAIDTNSPNNLNNRDRFIVLCDKRFVLQTAGPSGKHIKKYKRLSTGVAYKSGATVGDVTDITSGSLYMLAYRDYEMGGVDPSDPVTTVFMTGDIRLRYQDD